MPRQAHGRPVQAEKRKRPSKKTASKNRRLNALEIAEQEGLDEYKIPQHRFGVIDDDDDEPRNGADADDRSTKRRKVDMNGNAGSADEGSDVDGHQWHVGVDDEDEDSDIDSEEAFGGSDEERFADFNFGGSASADGPTKKPRRRPEHDLDESDAGESTDNEIEDDFGDEAVDLATAWDMDDEDEKEAAEKKKHKRGTPKEADNGDDDEDIDAFESGSDEEDMSEADEDEDGDSQLSISEDEGDHSRLQSFVEGLSSGQVPTSRRQQNLKTLTDKPSQFGLSSTKISAADLLQYIKDPRQRQALKVLTNSEDKGQEVYKGGVPGKLAPPLAKRQQDRLDREAAYEESKKELGKWIETVKRNRRAEHISFPLQDPAAAAAPGWKQLGPTSQSEPMTSLESTIQSIMIESGMLSKETRSLEQQEQVYEELQEKKIPLEEVQARRAELRRARELMFREEIRAKRIKKIKSKAYRRVHRKERERDDVENRTLLAAQGLIDSDEERERNDRRRAEERMGARHRESKWAKSVKITGRAAWDEDARHGVTDLARRDEELRRRIEGKAAAGSDESDSEYDDSDQFSGTDDEREWLKNKLDDIDRDEPESTETRLNSMAFMKKAEAARKAANDEEVRSLQRSLREENGEINGDSESDDEVHVGRQKFGGQGVKEQSTMPAPVQKSEFEERESDAERDIADEDEEVRGSRAAEVPAKKPAPNGEPVRTSKQNVTGKQVQEKKVELKGTNQKAAGTRVPRADKLQKKGRRRVEQELHDYPSPSESEDEQNTKSALARAIFAGPDEVEQDFAREKKETVKEEGDQVVDNSLPGWGSWTGEGVSKKAQKRAKGRFLTTIKGVSEEKRKDANLERVIINEKRVKKNSKYLASELPHPFETRQQYERSLRLPLGPEWTTKSTFQDATKPRVLMKQGIIRPMSRPLV
ncbi:hypothetical protein HRR83_000840 [Exophiala dermatitidis]|uniref:U3 small nucleolar RNA-associated protein 14 n=1 Tax=Exophiala dermatitidis TaxID=5970 RepID=A0AAN6F2M2_EXODE|nr:hypothetical protein HRR75_000760 [Exophiala dermatitidis]KAJ4528089.1 hypothetical protein HRR74_000844 [Exophiala dermatitidis]KAJ4528722.1 hypothetical protein HRR73_001345 [Exophiala dermatitidis]KAJ4530107.1 hypothetical protein HRR76_009341 [Exophiala dermatitidis]KAJ4553057.1 hypothetical protein HRR78_003316 [Exophiala dermatitidis]